jgi:heme oxygenase
MKSSFIETDLRNAAMRLHTKEQAPREGKALAVKTEPYVPTIQDYLQFLVDSKHVYEALEVAVNSWSELALLRCTGLERSVPLEHDILFITKEYGISRPSVGDKGKLYSSKIQQIIADGCNVPEFICHYYNFYFAHLAGGRMIGKKMSSLLLNDKTLEFYKV